MHAIALDLLTPRFVHWSLDPIFMQPLRVVFLFRSIFAFLHLNQKGSVPSRIVNKITASQPASVGRVKKFVEKMYQDEVDNPNRPASKFKMDALVLKEKLERAKEQLTKRSTDQSSTTSKEPPEVTSSPAPPVPLVNGDAHPESYTQVQPCCILLFFCF